MTGRGMNQVEVYSDLKPYYKSFYNAMQAWWPNRDESGWKLDADEIFVQDRNNNDCQPKPPQWITVTRELLQDAEALIEFHTKETPVSLPVRPNTITDIVFMGGDAAVGGFGAGTQHWDGAVKISYGKWTQQESDNGSNWRKANNLACQILSEMRMGAFNRKEVWMATDNLVWAYILKKGISKKKGLSDLVKDIKLKCRSHDIFFHHFHISGERMIALGFDRLSRGDLDSGIMLGMDFWELVPLDKSDVDIAGNILLSWTCWWMHQDPSKEPPIPAGWSCEGHRPGVHFCGPHLPQLELWSPLRKFSQAKLKQPGEVCHVFLCHRLLYYEEWKRRFEKELDFWMFIPTKFFWPVLDTAVEVLRIVKVYGVGNVLPRTPTWSSNCGPAVRF